MPLPKAILFDLDDTILSLESSIESSWETACRSFVASHESFRDYDLFHQKITEKRKWYWSDPERHKAGRLDLSGARTQIVRMVMNDLGFDDEPGARRLVAEYTKLQEDATLLFDGAYQALVRIREMGVRLAVITNGTSERQRGKLDKFNLSPLFDVILVEEEVGIGKPEPRIFEIALERLALSPQDVWVVGDNLVWEIEAPQKLGIYAVWNDFRQEGLPPGSRIRPDRIVASVSELSRQMEDDLEQVPVSLQLQTAADQPGQALGD
jgi:putative hydrolase of the HAD superfamily